MYAKVYKSMWEGSLAGSGETWAVFVFLLAHCDLEGFVDIHPKVISRLTGFEEPRVVKALAELEAADFNSRSQEQQGCRIERLDEHRTWGWQIVNYKKYRALLDSDMIRAQNRDRARNYRARRNAEALLVTPSNASSRHVEADVEVEAEEDKSKDLSPVGSGLSRLKVKRKPKTKTPEEREWEKTFDDWFWPAYWRKAARQKALESWMSIEPKTQETVDEIGSGLARHKPVIMARDKDVQPHATTWLNQKRWRDLEA